MKKNNPIRFSTFCLCLMLSARVSAQIPVVSSVSPGTGIPGSTSVTILGSGFNATPGNNIVYFGATRANVTAASATSLTATVPVGTTYMPVTVNNTASALMGYSQYPFLPTYDATGFVAGTVNFDNPVKYPDLGYSGPHKVVLSDIDGDGKADMVVGHVFGFSVFHNASVSGSMDASSFPSRVDFSTLTDCSTLAVGDLDGDGKPDVVVNQHYTSNTMYVFRNTASSGSITSGSFASGVAFAVSTGGFFPRVIGIGDVDGDGKADIVFINSEYGSGQIAVMQNTATAGSITAGSFADPVGFTSLEGGRDLILADFDGDGKPDVVVVNGSGDVSVHHNTATLGSVATAFAAGVDFAAGTQAIGLAAADIDGDGKLELVTIDASGSSMGVFLNTSTSGSITSGSFAAKVDFATESSPSGLTIADFDGDGKADIAVASLNSQAMSLFRNTATPGVLNAASLQGKSKYAGNEYRAIAAGDLDGDGIADIAAAGDLTSYPFYAYPGSPASLAQESGILVFRNNPSLPVVGAVSPNVSVAGTSVTITGSGFNSSTTDNVVYFGATRAAVTAASGTELTVTAPTGATYMPVTVSNSDHGLSAFAPYASLQNYDNSAFVAGTINFDRHISLEKPGFVWPTKVILSDIDGDGKSDLVTVYDGGFSVYHNQSVSGVIDTLSFPLREDFSTGSGIASQLAIGDINGDGKPDVAVSVQAGLIYVFENTATSGSITAGSFASVVTFDRSFLPGNDLSGISMGDVDADGRVDLVFAGGASGIGVLHNTGVSGAITIQSFSHPVFYGITGSADNLVLADIDGDGLPEAAVANGDGHLSVYRNISASGSISGTYATAVNFTAGADPKYLAAGDMDGDGKTDILVLNSTDNTLGVFRNTSSSGSITSGSLDAMVEFATGSTPSGLTIADFDGDGKADIAVACQSNDAVSLYRNTSTPGVLNASSFTAKNKYTGDRQEYGYEEISSVAAGDIDGDGLADLVAIAMAGDDHGPVRIFRNDPRLPVIGAVSPNTAAPGTDVTITGSGFNSSTTDNVVYFGAVRAAVTAASTTELTVTVPAGATYAPVSVNNTDNGLVAYAPLAFLPAFDNSAYMPGTVNFDPHVDFVTPSNATIVVLSDIDGDGKVDMIVGQQYGFSIYHNESVSGSVDAASFPVRQDFTGWSVTKSLAVGDIDGDGKPDIVAAGSSAYEVFRNTSSPGSIVAGSLEQSSPFDIFPGSAPAATSESMSLTDLDADGKPDLVFGCGVNGLYVHYNTTIVRYPYVSGSFFTYLANGSFSVPVLRSAATLPANSILVDIDGDGRPEAVAANNTGFMSVYYNTSGIGTITDGFAAPVAFTAGSNPVGLASGDIDGDGKQDLIVTDSVANTISVYRNTSSTGSITSGSFAAKVDFATGTKPFSLSIADFDGDGKADIAVACKGANLVSVFRNTATPGVINSSSLASGVDLATAAGTVSVAAGDIDGDGLADIVAVNRTANSVSVVRNNPLSGASGISGTLTVCAGATTTLTGTPTGGTWTSTTTSVATIGSLTGVVTGVSAGTSAITYTESAIEYIAIVSVNPAPDAITGTLTVCAGSSTTLSDATVGGTWSSSNTSAATVGSATGLVNGVAAGTTTISYVLPTGCSATTTLSVNPAPDAGAITGASSVSVGASIALSNAVSGGAWSSSNTSIATVGTSGMVTGVAAGVADISYQVTNGCGTATATHSVTVNAIAPITGPLSVCEGASITLANADPGGVWSSNNTTAATIGSTGVVSGLSPGTAIISYAISGSAVTAVVTVSAIPAAITGLSEVCAGSSITLSDATSGGSWSSSNTSAATIGTSGIVTGIGSGTTSITYTMPPACSVSTIITVNALPAAISGTLSVFEAGTTTLSSATSGGTWVSSNGSVATIDAGTGIATGVAPGTATITYALSTGCIRTAIITVNSLVGCDITGTLSACAGGTSTLSSSVSGGTWSSSNASVATVDASGVVSGVTSGTAAITYTAAGLCGTGTVAVVFTVYPLPAAIAGTALVCAGNTTTLSTSPSGGTWSSGSTSVATVNASGIVSGVAAGTSSITYTLSTGCAVKRDVTVNAVPSPISGTLSVCALSTSTLSSSTAGGNWSSSNTSVATVGSASGVVTGNSTGTSRITYSLATGCFATAVVSVNSTPSAIAGSLSVCVGSNTNLTSATFGGSWSSDDAGIASIVEATGVATGVATGTTIITYSNGMCATTAVVTVSTGAPAITGVATACVGQGTALSNATSGGTWSSGTTAVATVNTSGVVTGVSSGTATITYALGAGCYSTLVVTVSSSLSSITGSLTACPGATTALGHATSGGVWSSSNTTKATIDAGSGVVTGVAAGTTNITYAVGGCSTTSALTVNYNPGTIGGTAAVCEGSTTGFTCSPGGGTWSSSDVLVATISSTGVVTGTGGGTATISYTVGTGCASVKVVTVSALPSAISGTLTACIGASNALSATPGGGTWTSSSTYVAPVGYATGILTGSHAGTTRITYTVAGGCRTIAVATVNMSPGSISGLSSLCAGGNITLSSATWSGVWSSSDGAVASVATASITQGLVTGISAGTTTISYTVGSCSTTKIVTVNTMGGTITGDAVVCVGQTNATLSSGLSGGSWSSSASAIANVHAANGLITGVSAGTATITYTASAGCYITAVATVSAPVSAITGPASVIVGNNITLSNATTGGTWSCSNTYKATIVAGTGVLTGVAAGTATITYMVSAGCYTTRGHTTTYSRPEGIAVSPMAFAVYPNPSSGALTVRSSVSGKFIVYTIDGREIGQYVITAPTSAVLLPSDLAAGAYMCRFMGEDGSAQVVRLIYNH